MEQRVDVDVLDRALELAHLVDADDRPQRVERMAVALLAHDRELLVDVRDSRARSEEEAVELRLGQRECALLLDRVLRRDERGTASGSARVTPSTVTCCSAIASSSADCVFGIARLISSTSRTFANTGPAGT